MNRARGKQTGRKPTVAADSPEGRQIGAGALYDHPLPGGETHLVNQPVKHEKPAVPDQRQRDEGFEGWLAHGVPPLEHGVYDRKDMPGAKRGDYKPDYTEQAPAPMPVPVYIVESRRGTSLRATAMRHFMVPPIGSEPLIVCGQDTDRISVRVLNEGLSSGTPKGVRIGGLSDLAWDAENGLIVGGALLPNTMTSYLEIKTQSPLYVVSMDSNQPYLSVIIETEVAGA